jgi:AI-2 transport protein TqsA
MANSRLQALVYGSVLALIFGWVLHVGKGVFVPIVLSALIVYVIVGLTRLLAGIPVVGRRLPLQLRYALSVLASAAVLAGIAYVTLANLDRVLAQGPQHQASLLAAIQQLAVRLGVENEPTWTTLRQVFLEQVSVQAVVGTTVYAATTIVAGGVVVFLYVAFLLLEQPTIPAKLDAIATDPRSAARVREVYASINARIGAYLALKTFVSVLLGAVSWAVMAAFGLELAVFWAMLIGLLNYVPYIGSFLGVLFPVVLAVAQFGDAGTVISLLLALTVAQFAIGNFLDPYLMGNSLNLSPFAILVSLTVWSALWGIPGAFLSVPITAVMAIVFSEFSGTRPIAVLLSRAGRLS